MARHAALPRQDALSLLRAEHDMLLGLFGEYERLHAGLARDDGRKAALAGRICRELSVHAALEEQAFYPAILAAHGASPLLGDALVEHEAQQLLIGQLSILYPDDPFFGATVAVLGEETRHHIVHEQGALFECARTCGLDLQLLACELVERRRALAGRPVPGTAPATVAAALDWAPRPYE
ncbi:MAG TPA: hemerythrin domain-containing protein [Telluria sp.]